MIQLSAIAQKRGLVAFVCNTIPDAKTRLKINRQLTRSHREHFVIYTNQQAGKQVWYWVRCEQGKPLSAREHHYDIKQNGDALIQKLNLIKVSMADEEKIDLPEMEIRTRKALGVERVTRRFYDSFAEVHVDFLGFIEGIPEAADREWYTSVMLNRLMFVYFIQRKGFLDADPDYLRNRLKACQKKTGDGKFYTFYRYFLLKLFHQGLGKRKEERKSGLDKFLGKIPYLNGGIFDVHELEQKYDKSLEIPDKAFEKIFDYFDQYQWNLDDRPLRNDNEINPDVLGYIFEKYINQKQMGAYYTKEDSTEYISKNTIIPFLFDSVRTKCPHHFENVDGPTIWDLQMNNPDRYIYPAIQHGKDLPLPPEIEKGLDPSLPNLIKRRKAWNKPAPENFALPKEIWREVVARRERYETIYKKLENGELRNINDFITYNLDIRQFAQDVIDNCDDPDLLQALWHSISNITILDPTGGSGAFLFAALNILEAGYEACLEKMQSFLDEWGESGNQNYLKFKKNFTEVRNQVKAHPNRRYFILKSIILKNLYAVDIMEEAVEICKLRLFLKLAAQVDPDDKNDNLGIEPLPDIDFNIRAGNTLIGYVTYEEVKHAITSKFDFDDTMPIIEAKAASIQKVFDKFRLVQTEGIANEIVELKQQLTKELAALENELNKYLAGEYGVNVNDKAAFARWVKSHQPFHWFIEFYGILNSGGFDVIIGNPPYVEYSKKDQDTKLSIRDLYLVRGYKTLSSNNLYAFTMERTLSLQSSRSWSGMIVPVSFVSGDSYAPLVELMCTKAIWLSSFSNRPAKLFDGVEQRLTIYIRRNTGIALHSAPYSHWYSEERDHLFARLSYVQTARFGPCLLPLKIGRRLERTIMDKIICQRSNVSQLEGRGKNCTWFHDGPTYWIRALPFEPNEGIKSSRSNHYHSVSAANQANALVVCAILNSSLFYLFFKAVSNCRDFGGKELYLFRIPESLLANRERVVSLANELGKKLKATAHRTSRLYDSGEVHYEEYYPQLSKPILDEIDTVLAKHYGFTAEELDFIINYDIKYRMGNEL